MADNKAARIEAEYNEFQEKREALGEAILKIKDELKNFIDRWYDEITKVIDNHIEQNDAIIAANLKEFQALVSRKREVDIRQAKFDPFIKILSDAKSGKLAI